MITKADAPPSRATPGRLPVGGEGARGGAEALEGVGSPDDGGDGAAVERLGQGVAGHVGLRGAGGLAIGLFLC